MGKIIKIGYAKFWTENDILYCQFRNKNSNYKLDSDEVKLCVRAIIKLCKGKAMPFLIDARDSRGTFSSAAANLFANHPSLIKLRISEAFVLNTIGIKLLISSYKRIYEPNTPFAIFDDMVAAKHFCSEYKDTFYASC